MIKLYSSALSLIAAAAISAGAQQLPNVGFNSWKTACGSSEGFGKGGTTSPAAGEMRQRPGIEPEGWNGSSVNQKVMVEKKEELVARATEGDNTVVQLQNKFVGVMSIGSVAPGFITLGTPWVYAESNLDNCDGGVYGGIEVNSIPDAIAADCKRTDTTGENSHLIAYLWTGTFESKVGSKNSPSQTRQDVTAAVMGKANESIVTSKGTLIAQTDLAFTTTDGEWQTLVAELDYNDATVMPTKANVIVSSGEFWDRGALKEGTTLLADNVRFVYYSRLSAIICGDQTIDIDDSNITYNENGRAELNVPFNFEEFSSIQILGRSATNSDPYNFATERPDGGIDCTIEVSNSHGEDIDGRTSHTYILHFAAPEVKSVDYPGYLTIIMDGEMLANDQEAVITITPTGENLCTFTLPNFSLALDGGDPVPLGDIVVPDVKIEETTNGTHYTGAVKDMELLGGELVADVNLDGTIDANDNALMKIQVLWMGIPIDVTFSSTKGGACVIAADQNHNAEYYTINGIRISSANLTPGSVIIVRTGNKTQKILVK